MILKEQYKQSHASALSQELQQMEIRMSNIMQEVRTELLRLKYKVYEKRTLNLLDTAERKLKNAKDKLLEGDDYKIVMNKLKVCQFKQSSMPPSFFCI